MQISSISFILWVGAFHLAHGQVCTWTKVQPLSATYTRSVSSSVEIIMTATNENFPDGGRLTWEGKKGTVTVDLSILRYSQSANSFTEILSSPRGNSSSLVGNHNISLTSLKISDDGLQISAVSGGCTSDDRSPTITLEVKYCNLSYFAPDATATNASDCEYNCQQTFVCQVYDSLTFNATCQADATWSQDMAQCGFCNATAFEPTAIQVDNGPVTGVNQTKVFDCVCPTGVQSFVAECQPDLNWNYTANTIPCRAACDASEVTFASPGNASFMCGVQPFTCNSRLSCAPNTFDLQCADDGTWVSLENKCIEETCNSGSIADICQDKCQYGSISEITCGEPLNYTCVDGAVASSPLPVVCNASNSFNNSGPLCFFNESCQETCNRDSIADICQDRCQYGNTSEIACGEPLNYNCVDGAVASSLFPVVCNESNSFNYSGPLCFFNEPCQETCNLSAIQAICGDFCQYENVTEVGCNETLTYTCTGDATPATSTPVQCIGTNNLSLAAPLCVLNSTQENSTCTDTCDRSSIQAICHDSCNHEDISEVTCNESLSYTCAGSLFVKTAPAVLCIRKNVFNWSEPLCKCQDHWKEVVPYVMLGTSCFSNALLCIYLCYWYGTCLSKLHKPETSVAVFATLLPVIGILLCIANIIMVPAAGFCSPATVYGGTALGSFLIVFNLFNFLMIICSDQSKYLESQSTSRWLLFKELICAPCSGRHGRNAKYSDDRARGKALSINQLSGGPRRPEVY